MMFGWILFFIITAITLFLLSIFDGRGEELRETVFPEGSLTVALTEAFSDPQDRLRYFNKRINSKHTQLEISQERLDETKKTISDLELTSDEVQQKYRDLLKQLKSELTKTESECKSLHTQIESITTKRDQLKHELFEHKAEMELKTTDLQHVGYLYKEQTANMPIALPSSNEGKIIQA